MALQERLLAKNASEVARVTRPPAAADTLMAQALREQGPVPRTARATTLAQQELHAAIAERNAAELERLGRLRVPEAANTALADNLRSGALTELNQRLQSGSKWQRDQLLPQRESALLQQLTARLSKAVEDMQAAKAAGDPSALQRARAQAEQAQTILRSAEGGMFTGHALAPARTGATPGPRIPTAPREAPIPTRPLRGTPAEWADELAQAEQTLLTQRDTLLPEQRAALGRRIQELRAAALQ